MQAELTGGYGEVFDEMDHQAKYQPAVARQQLVARIKKNSKYWGQTAPNEWFDVRVVPDNYYQLRGNQNNYRFSDVVMGIRIDGAIVDFKTGKSST
jgi:hypothetical protein